MAQVQRSLIAHGSCRGRPRAAGLTAPSSSTSLLAGWLARRYVQVQLSPLLDPTVPASWPPSHPSEAGECGEVTYLSPRPRPPAAGLPVMSMDQAPEVMDMECDLPEVGLYSSARKGG